jgi:hypothetical protein
MNVLRRARDRRLKRAIATSHLFDPNRLRAGHDGPASATQFLKNFVDIPNSPTQYLVPDISLIQYVEYLWNGRCQNVTFEGEGSKEKKHHGNQEKGSEEGSQEEKALTNPAGRRPR